LAHFFAHFPMEFGLCGEWHFKAWAREERVFLKVEGQFEVGDINKTVEFFEEVVEGVKG